MLFASDLDRTLIYSKRFVTEMAHQEELTTVEQGVYTSYTTKKAAALLRLIAEQVLFIPCTTRVIEQYQRIQFFQNTVIPKYAIVSNGGNLIIDGVVDKNYQQAMLRELTHNSLPAADLISEFRKIATPNWVEKTKDADNLFYYCLIDRAQTPKDELQHFSQWAVKQNWHVSVQGRKLYLVPQAVNKWSGVKKLLEQTENNKVFAAGDSLLDLPLLQGADYAYSPRHGELYQQYQHQQNDISWQFTAATGIVAAEEILNKLQGLLE
ncbi:MAG: HAD hydrolase family protein [Desulfotomaculum sp.]|nr:HAD hydrolase family protein [Desulfotomaculum sp.]MCL0080975.1 HAD hydrolase family protein [Peptococcaceae bacterium]